MCFIQCPVVHPFSINGKQTHVADSTKFALGVCNGCQMLSNVKELIPGTECWPHFVRNKSEQFEVGERLGGTLASGVRPTSHASPLVLVPNEVHLKVFFF